MQRFSRNNSSSVNKREKTDSSFNDSFTKIPEKDRDLNKRKANHSRIFTSSSNQDSNNDSVDSIKRSYK
jgi:hypothetical protein